MRQGFFVLSVATFEVTLGQVLRYYLRWFPQKLPEKQLNMGDGILAEDILDSLIDNYLMGLSFKSKQDLLHTTLDLLSIDDKPIPDDLGAAFLETTERRNLLLHNGLVVNDRYRERLGIVTSEPHSGTALKIDDTYLGKSLQAHRALLETLESRLRSKYSERTYLAAVRSLWEFTFHTPLAWFDNWWVVDEDKDRIVAIKPDPRRLRSMISSLSHSERMYMGMWLAQFTGTAKYLDRFSMSTLTDKSKMLFFLSVVDDLKLGSQ